MTSSNITRAMAPADCREVHLPNRQGHTCARTTTRASTRQHSLLAPAADKKWRDAVTVTTSLKSERHDQPPKQCDNVGSATVVGDVGLLHVAADGAALCHPLSHTYLLTHISNHTHGRTLSLSLAASMECLLSARHPSPPARILGRTSHRQGCVPSAWCASGRSAYCPFKSRTSRGTCPVDLSLSLCQRRIDSITPTVPPLSAPPSPRPLLQAGTTA